MELTLPPQVHGPSDAGNHRLQTRRDFTSIVAGGKNLTDVAGMNGEDLSDACVIWAETGRRNSIYAIEIARGKFRVVDRLRETLSRLPGRVQTALDIPGQPLLARPAIDREGGATQGRRERRPIRLRKKMRRPPDQGSHDLRRVAQKKDKGHIGKDAPDIAGMENSQRMKLHNQSPLLYRRLSPQRQDERPELTRDLGPLEPAASFLQEVSQLFRLDAYPVGRIRREQACQQGRAASATMKDECGGGEQTATGRRIGGGHGSHPPAPRASINRAHFDRIPGPAAFRPFVMELSSIMGPVEWADFVRAFEAMQTFPGECPDRSRFESLWADWEFDAVCRFVPLPNLDDFRLIRDGRHLPASAYRDRSGMVNPEAVRQLFTRGLSVVMVSVETYSERLLALCRGLEAALHCPAQANLYATPGSAQGLKKHVDRHDVLILQLRGEKTWDIYPPDYRGGESGAKPETVVLRSGSWLYVPKGIWHEVRNAGPEPSVHLTIGFHPLTWTEVLQAALDEARLTEPALRERIPYGAPPVTSIDEYNRRLASLVPHINPGAQARAYFANFPQFAQPAPNPIARAEIEACTEHSRFAWQDSDVTVDSGAAGLLLKRPHRRFPLELRPELEPLVRRMRQEKSFRPCDLESGERALLLCRLLANTGMLSLA